MEISYRTDKNILYIAIEGRLDASNAGEADARMLEIRSQNRDKHTVIDAEKLSYISSAGLRVILKIRKEEPKLAIINAAPDVYEIFEMTGFTEMITVEKAYPAINIEGCEFIARGANGAVYRYDAETIVKTYFSADSLPEIKQERENARKVFVLGINTAIPYGIVRVGEGYGTVTELLEARSITKIIRDDPDDLEDAANYYIDMLKSIHAVELEEGEFPDMRETAISWAEFVKPHLEEGRGEKLLELVKAVPKCNTLLHGDYHTNNIMVREGEPLLIDMDTICMGHPIFEFGSMFNAFLGFAAFRSEIEEDFFGYTRNTARKFWELSIKKYFGTDDEEFCKKIEEKAMVIGYLRLLRRSIRRPNEENSAQRIAHSKACLAELLEKVDKLDF